MGGALGNVIDRVTRGYVVDFVDFYVGSWHFAAFNVADAAITCGAALLILDMLIDTVRSRSAKAAPCWIFCLPIRAAFVLESIGQSSSSIVRSQCWLRRSMFFMKSFLSGSSISEARRVGKGCGRTCR